jgi:hypothetical protein
MQGIARFGQKWEELGGSNAEFHLCFPSENEHTS